MMFRQGTGEPAAMVMETNTRSIEEALKKPVKEYADVRRHLVIDNCQTMERWQQRCDGAVKVCHESWGWKT